MPHLQPTNDAQLIIHLRNEVKSRGLQTVAKTLPCSREVLAHVLLEVARPATNLLVLQRARDAGYR